MAEESWTEQVQPRWTQAGQAALQLNLQAEVVAEGPVSSLEELELAVPTLT